MAPDAEPPFPDPEAETPPSRRRGIGLCLSGGGFRATLFHAGAIKRLFELGIATRPDFDTVASVSGGSLTAAQWAVALSNAPVAERSPLATNVEATQNIIRPLLALTARDIRTGAMAKKFLLPWNWFRGAYAVNAMVDKFEAAFGKVTLNLLPERPRFIFCATDMAFGASFIFERDRVGSYLAGYAPPEGFTLAQAVAASACFPPLFGPLRIERAPERFKGGRAPGLSADERRKILEDLRVTDGGVYDNMGLEPVWKSHRVVLVSDAGGLMDAEADNSWTWRIKRYQSIQECQARGVRKRFLIAGFTQGTIKGAYIGVSGSTARYEGARDPGYSKEFASDVIANIRTDLDAFSEVEQGVLMNHGYALIDAAIRTHA
ncbi:MAG: patatin-like phospholipase family protein, partial [Vicinamibacteria bacterium]|nr:patatin-like phospholipase family protein [Vicinamibacteria bacterium]